MRLTWQSKIVSGSTIASECGLSQSAKLRLGGALGACGIRRGSRRRRPAAEASATASRSVTQASPMASRDERRRGRIGQQQPAPRRDAVGLVVEALGERLGEVAHRRRAQESEWMAATPLVLCEPTIARFAMRRSAPSGPSSIRLDAAARAVVAGETGADVVEEAAVDLVDDLQVARQQDLEPFDRPLLQRLGQAGCDWCRRASGW